MRRSAREPRKTPQAASYPMRLAQLVVRAKASYCAFAESPLCAPVVPRWASREPEPESAHDGVDGEKD